MAKKAAVPEVTEVEALESEVNLTEATPEGKECKFLADALEVMSLRQISIATGATYNVLLKASKAPVPGVAYDPEMVNFDAIKAALVRKLTSDGYLSLDWNQIIEDATKDGAGLRSAVAADMTDFAVDDVVKLRDIKDKAGNVTVLPLYRILYLTGTHVILLPTEFENTTPRIMSYDTFLHQGGRKA